MVMRKMNQYSFILFFSATVGLVYLALCLAAEFKKSQRSDLRFDGRLCYLPGSSSAVGFGISALICLSITQVIGNLFVCTKFISGEQSRGCAFRKPSFSCMLLVFSWISFGLAVILISGATSMSRNQTFGEGWLDEECYFVKDGVYAGSAALGLLALGSTLGSGAIATRQRQAREENRKDISCTSL